MAFLDALGSPVRPITGTRDAASTRIAWRGRHELDDFEPRKHVKPFREVAATVLNAAAVNVPLEMRGAFERVEPESYGRPNVEDKHFEARVAFGRRLEPWLISAAKR